MTTQNEFDQFYIDTQNSMIANFWKAAYKTINRTNTVLGRIDGINIDAGLANRYKLECKFIRALMYFNLVRVYGDVPLVLKEISISESYEILREPKENVYNQIITDLKEAQGLPVSYPTAEDGRATQGAAKALLADVYMTLHKYAEAETILAEIINSGRYSLLENTPGSLNIDGYKDVFSPVNHNSKEGIFEIQFLKGGYNEGSNYANNFAPENSGTNVVAVGGTGGNNVPEMDIYNAYEEGDLRRDFSMSLGYYDNRKNNEWVESRYVCKFMDVPYQGNDASNNYPVIRYADVILMYAEALNQNGKTAEACKYLNMTRRRGFGYQTTETSPVDLQTTDKAQFALLVEQERRVELAFENHRWVRPDPYRTCSRSNEKQRILSERDKPDLPDSAETDRCQSEADAERLQDRTTELTGGFGDIRISPATTYVCRHKRHIYVPVAYIYMYPAAYTYMYPLPTYMCTCSLHTYVGNRPAPFPFSLSLHNQ